MVENLIYAAYRHNRELSPHVEPERWGAAFHGYDVAAMEERYQHERHATDGPHCCDLASDGLACDCADRLADELDEAKLRDASMEQKTADELDEYLNDLCNRRTDA